MTKSSVENVDIKENRCVVNINGKKGESTIDCDVVLSAVGIAASRNLLKTRNSQPIPGPGSIFQPHRNSLVNRWQKRLERFRLR